MKKDLERTGPEDSGEMIHGLTAPVDDIVASRAVATDRVYKGGTLAVLSFAGALLLDFMNLGPGLPLWIGLAATLTGFGAGAVWAGTGASHLIRHGRRGSSLWLISLAGLGGSVIVNVLSGILSGIWNVPFLVGLNLLAQYSGAFFTFALIILGLITIVRWMLPEADPPGKG